MKNMLYCELCLNVGIYLKFHFKSLYLESSLLLLTLGGTGLGFISGQFLRGRSKEMVKNSYALFLW